MITIFQGRKISLDGTEDQVYASIAVAMRDKLHEFNTGKNLNPFAVFMKIALHADKDGWAFPGRNSIKKGTGLSSDGAIASAIKHLNQMQIDGHPVMAWYRAQDPQTGQWRGSLYRIFPAAWQDSLESIPEKFKGMKLHLQEPPPDNLGVDKPGVDKPPYKYNHSEGDPVIEGSPQAAKAEIIENEDIPIPGVEEPWKGPPPAAARVFRSRTNRWPPRATYRRIHEAVGDRAEDLERWGDTVSEYVALGWNPTNVAGMLEWFEKGELPKVQRKNGGGKSISQQIAEYRAGMAERAQIVEGAWEVL